MKILTFLKRLINNFYELGKTSKNVYLLMNKRNLDTKKIKEITSRVEFFFNSHKVIILDSPYRYQLLSFVFRKDVKLLLGYDFSIRTNSLLKNFLFFNIDPYLCHDDGWNWHYALASCFNFGNIEAESLRKLVNIKRTNESYQKSYLIGTGPSLEKAIDLNWSDGIRIVSNSIVKDKELFHHIDPQLIVACDAIYHFGQNLHSELFLADLKKRLSETNAYFAFPIFYYPFVSRHLPLDKLIAIPVNNHELLNTNLLNDFFLPTKIGNVLNIMLLPLGSSLSKEIHLFGFDGRAPDDIDFWKNSEKHTYSLGVIDLKNKHPFFFDTLVPKDNPTKYVQAVHGDVLESILNRIEYNEIKIRMMHKSWTPSLSKRHE